VAGDHTNDVEGYIWLLTWQVYVDQSGIAMCHRCKGDTWHIRTHDVPRLYDADKAYKWTNQRLTHGGYLANSVVPCGLNMGFHMAPIHFLFGSCKNIRSSPDLNPIPSVRAKALVGLG
jgi:hypothetical protein